METIILFGLITYAVTYVFVYSAGPYDSLEKLRTNKRVYEFGLFECLPCTALWVALAATLLASVDNWPIVWLSSWGIAIILDKLIRRIDQV